MSNFVPIESVYFWGAPIALLPGQEYTLRLSLVQDSRASVFSQRTFPVRHVSAAAPSSRATRGETISMQVGHIVVYAQWVDSDDAWILHMPSGPVRYEPSKTTVAP